MTFKFFRSWNKRVIFILMSVLMVVFLVEGSCQMRGQGGGVDLSKEPIGTLAGTTLTVAQQRSATQDVHIVGALTPYLVAHLQQEKDSNAALSWLLVLEDSKRLGISASDAEANTLLTALGLGEEEKLAQIGGRLQSNGDAIRAAYRNWIIVQQYRELSLGLSHTSISQWASIITTISQFSRELQREDTDAMTRMFVMNHLSQMLESAQGQPRISDTLVARVVLDQQASVKVTTVLVNAEKYAPDAQPTAAEIQELFEKNKDRLVNDLPDAAIDGFNFGYKFPDRVKLEYLAIPGDELARKVEIDEADALMFYEQNPQMFTERTPPGTQPATAPAVRSYESVRNEVLSTIRDQKSRALGDRVVRDVESILAQDVRKLPEADGYRQLPADYKPVPLETAVQEIQKRHGIKATALRLDEQWVPVADLPKLAGLGDVTIEQPGRWPAPLSEYVRSAKEFSPNKDNLLTALRLQVNIPSTPLTSKMDGGRYIFRLIAAEPARPAKDLEEVRDRVTRDAKRLAAYRKLQADRDKLMQRFAGGDVNLFANQVKGQVIETTPFSRRRLDRGGAIVVPSVKEIGTSKAFVDGVFQLTEKFASPDNIATAPAAKRSGVADLDDKFALAFFRLDEFTPLTKRQFEMATANPQMAVFALQSMSVRKPGEADPMSFESLAKRLNFIRHGEKS